MKNWKRTATWFGLACLLFAVAALAQSNNGIRGTFNGHIFVAAPYNMYVNGHEGSTNKDVVGTCTLGTNCVITFNRVYKVAPVCVATDTTAAAATKSVTTTTTATFTGTGTDVLGYQCMGTPD